MSDLSFYEHMVAGAAAGVAEHVSMFPLDTVKTRMQVAPGAAAAEGAAVRAQAAAAMRATGQCCASHAAKEVPNTVLRSLQCIISQEGILGLYRGCSAMGLGAGPAHALYFATFELAKARLEGAKARVAGPSSTPNPLLTGAAGACATVVGDAVITPLDTIKQRMQLEGSPYRTILGAARGTYRAEGLSAFYRSYRTTLVMNVPFTAVHFGCYEAAKQALWDTWLHREGEEEGGPFLQAAAGGMAGGFAAAATNPLDVVKTRLQTSSSFAAEGEGLAGVVSATRRIVREEGAGALWKGVRPRVLFHIPAAAICWTTYETCKIMIAHTPENMSRLKEEAESPRAEREARGG